MVLDTTWHYRYTSSFRSEEDITITTENDRGSGRLLMFRDSFGNAVLPFFAEAFREAEFSRAVPYRLDLTAARQADGVVVEIVERNLPDLTVRAPVMPAPRRICRGMPQPTGARRRVSRRARPMASSTYTASWTRVTAAAQPLYLRAGGVGYEAFPIREEALLDEGEGAGFSAYLPPGGGGRADRAAGRTRRDRHGPGNHPARA